MGPYQKNSWKVKEKILEDWIFIFPPNLYVEILTPKVIELGGGIFAGWLGQESGALMNGVNDFIKETPECTLTPTMTWGFKESHFEEAGPPQTSNLLAPNLGSASLLCWSLSWFSSYVDVCVGSASSKQTLHVGVSGGSEPDPRGMTVSLCPFSQLWLPPKREGLQYSCLLERTFHCAALACLTFFTKSNSAPNLY